MKRLRAYIDTSVIGGVADEEFAALRRWFMAKPTKKFDCVEMKRRAQERLIAEYEAGRNEYDSYLEFLTSTNDGSSFVCEMRRRYGKRSAVEQTGDRSERG
jgi:hypothetical protein